MQYTPRLLVSPRVHIKRKRELPIPGECLVSKGATVNSFQPVLQTIIKGDIRVVKVRELLGIKEENIKDFFQISEGQEVQSGDSLFIRKGLFGFFPEIIKSPITGLIEFINYEAGHVGIRSAGRKFELNAYVTGVVTECDNISITVESEAALVKGLYGFGGEVAGTLVYIKNSSDKIITEEDIRELSKTRDLDSCIIAGGSQFSLEAVRELVKLRVRGVITASCSTSFINSEFSNKLVFVITEGFGKHFEKSNLFQIYTLGDGENCSLSGAVQIRAGAIRPELIIHKRFSEYPIESEDSSSKLEEGATVRIIRGNKIGNLGKIKNLIAQPVIFDSGIETFAAEVNFLDGSTTISPLANLEMI